MSVTLDVSKCDTSTLRSPEQPWNIPNMFVTFDVSKCDTSRSDNCEQSRNMEFMFVTFDVLTLSKCTIFVRLKKLANRHDEFAGREGYLPRVVVP